MDLWINSEHWEIWNSPEYQCQITTGQDFVDGFKCRCIIEIYEEIQGCTIEAPSTTKRKIAGLMSLHDTQ